MPALAPRAPTRHALRTAIISRCCLDLGCRPVKSVRSCGLSYIAQIAYWHSLFLEEADVTQREHAGDYQSMQARHEEIVSWSSASPGSDELVLDGVTGGSGTG